MKYQWFKNPELIFFETIFSKAHIENCTLHLVVCKEKKITAVLCLVNVSRCLSDLRWPCRVDREERKVFLEDGKEKI